MVWGKESDYGNVQGRFLFPFDGGALCTWKIGVERHMIALGKLGLGTGRS
jgi:hypothetical protein